MPHSQDHKVLMAGLLMGGLDAEEMSAAELLLSTCPECPRLLDSYQAALPMDEASLSRAEVPVIPSEGEELPSSDWRVQLPLTISGSHSAVAEILGQLRSLLSQLPTFEMRRALLASGSSGVSREVVAITSPRGDEQLLVAAVQRYLQWRRDQQGGSQGVVTVGSYLRISESDQRIEVVTRKDVPEDKLTDDRLRGLIMPFGSTGKS